MALTVDTQNHQSPRKLGNIFCSWTIDNYAWTFFIPDCRILSPEFQVRGPQTTTWQLILSPYTVKNEKRQFVFRLHRLDNKPAASVVGADWKIALMVNEECLLYSKTGYSFFEGDSWYESVVSDNAPGIFETLNSFKSNSLLVKFQIIVNHREANNRFEVISDAGLKSLSRDLFTLYKRRICTDVVIRTRDKGIRAHKAILQSRSSYFKLFFEQHQNIDMLDLNEFDYKTLNNMFSYLYSGKLEFVLGKPSIAMYDCAARFRIEEVNRYYVLDYLQLVSKVDLIQKYHEWHISYFKTRNEGVIQSNKIFIVPNLEVILNLFRKDGDDGSTYVKVSLKIRCDIAKQYVICLKSGILDSNKELACVSKKALFVKNESLLEYFHWPKEIVNSFVSVDGTLSMATWFQVCDSEAPWKSSTITILNPFSNPNETEHSYKRLSNDIRSLLTSGSFSDYNFVFQNKKYEVHRCILAERLYAYLKKLRKTIVYDVHRKTIKSHIGNILVNYLYGGILNNCNSCDAMELYGVADMYLLPILKVTCSRFLQSCLTVENVIDILLFAAKEQDEELKISALKVISLNFQDVSAQQNFQLLEKSNLLLHSEACEFERKDNSSNKHLITL